MFFNPLYIIISLPALLLGMWAQFKVKSTYSRFSQIRSYTGATGAQVARHILDENGLQEVPIEQTNGILSDHYDPGKKILRLSGGVYGSGSIASAGVAAHEAGHALQHAAKYLPLKIRSLMVPSVQIGSWLGPIIFTIGLIMNSAFGESLALIGLIFFAATGLFALVTLPVELDASRRAKIWLVQSGVLTQAEMPGVNAVLNAAAWTYVAGSAQAISSVIYYLIIFLSRSKRR